MTDDAKPTGDHVDQQGTAHPNSDLAREDEVRGDVGLPADLGAIPNADPADLTDQRHEVGFDDEDREA